MTQENDSDSALPPDVGRTTESSNSRDVETTARGGHGGESDAPEPVNPEVSSQEPADAGDQPPEGVGESQSRSGQDIKSDDGKEAGRHEEGSKGQTERPAGSSDERDRTGI